MSTASKPNVSRQGSLRSRPVSELFNDMLFSPVPTRPLVYFRIVLGLLLFKTVYTQWSNGWIAQFFINPATNFNFSLFPWVEPLPGAGMFWVFGTLAVAAICFTLGLGFRIASAIYCIGFLYVFLIERALYLNHNYVVVLLTLLMTLSPANRMFSLDTKFGLTETKEYIPAWSLWLLRIQIGVIYFYGGLVKINADWLSGVPMKATAHDIVGLTGLPGSWENNIAIFMVYAGMFYDLLVFPCLLHKKLRWVALAASLGFHLTNHFVFSIGIFPWMMIGASFLLFFNDLLPRLPGETKEAKESESARGEAEVASFLTPRRKKLMAVFFVAYVGYQILMPLRSYLYAGNVNWTQNGDHFSWRMMLNRRICSHFEIRGEYEENGETVRVRIPLTEEENGHIFHWQYGKMTTAPDMILQCAHWHAEELRKQGKQNVKIYIVSHVSLNGRPPQLLVNPQVDLAAEKRHMIMPYDWVLPLDPRLKPYQLDEFSEKLDEVQSDE